MRVRPVCRYTDAAYFRARFRSAITGCRAVREAARYCFDVMFLMRTRDTGAQLSLLRRRAAASSMRRAALSARVSFTMPSHTRRWPSFEIAARDGLLRLSGRDADSRGLSRPALRDEAAA